MVIIPAIDIRNEKCVRLTQGDYAKETIYDNDIVSVARKWVKEGASLLHIVDLDGAKAGTVINIQAIKKIIEDVNIPIQIGGGIRTLESIQTLINLGVYRVILGTVAIENTNSLKKLIALYGSKIIVSLDAENGKLMKKGWLEKSNFDLIPTVKQLEITGVKTIIYTDTTRDGTLTEPNYQSIKKLRINTKMKLIVAGGISSLDQIKKLKKMKADGVIIGKSIYEGKIKLKEAIKYAN